MKKSGFSLKRLYPGKHSGMKTRWPSRIWR